MFMAFSSQGREKNIIREQMTRAPLRKMLPKRMGFSLLINKGRISPQRKPVMIDVNIYKLQYFFLGNFYTGEIFKSQERFYLLNWI
jgi:hypothetical protein